jgi:multiple sugar transport system permease protein
MTGRSGVKLLRSALIYGAALVVIIETLAPVYWMIVTSISDSKDLLSLPPHWMPEHPTLARYQAIFSAGQVSLWSGTTDSPGAAFLRGVLNSLLVAGLTTLICLFFGLLTAYAMSRLRFRGKRALMLSLLAVQMLPAIALVIPLFFIIRIVGLVDTPTSLILTYSGFTITYAVWVLTSYLNSLPFELEEAAFLDGCSRLQALRYVTFPLAVPGLIAVGIFSFLVAWNEFLYALVFTHTAAAKTLPVIISEFSTQFGLDYGMVMTGGVIASIPPVVLALVFQRYIVRGLSAGAIKG